MSIQSVVNIEQAYGIPGTMALDSPRRASSYLLNSSSAALNIVGATAFTQSAQMQAAAGGTGVYLGILSHPQSGVLTGTPSPLSPSMTLQNGVAAEIVNMGDMWVKLPAPANIGDVVIFNQTTGVISTITRGTSLPAGSTYANANVLIYNVSTGIALIRLTTNLFV